MLHPVPGGPSLPERTRGGRKKSSVDAAVPVTSRIDPNSDTTGSANNSAVSTDNVIAPERGGGSGGAGIGTLNGIKNSNGDTGRKNSESIAVTTADRTPLKRKRRKRAAGEPSIDALCLHIKPGRKAGWAAIQAANAAAAAESLLYSGGEDMSDEDEDGGGGGGGGGDRKLVTSNNNNNSSSSSGHKSSNNLIQPAANIAPSAAITGPFHILSGGCTRHTAGEGAIHTRYVDSKSSIFHREGRSREARKEILRNELLRITEALHRLQSLAGERDREKVAERERLKAAVLSRGLPLVAQRGYRGVEGTGGSASGSGSRDTEDGRITKQGIGKRGLIPMLVAQKQLQQVKSSHLAVPAAVRSGSKKVSLSGNNGKFGSSSNSESCEGLGSEFGYVNAPPKVWMPTALFNLNAVAYREPSGNADIETSSETSERGRKEEEEEEEEGEEEGEGSDNVGTGESDKDRDRDRERSDRDGVGERYEEEGEEDIGSNNGLGDVETEDEAELRDGDKTDDDNYNDGDNDEDDGEEDGMLAMTSNIQASDAETEDEPSGSEDEVEEDEGSIEENGIKNDEGDEGDDQYPRGYQYQYEGDSQSYGHEQNDEGDDEGAEDGEGEDEEEEDEEEEAAPLLDGMDVAGVEDEEETRGVSFSSEDDEEEEEEEDGY